MTPTTELYFETHITIDPVSEDQEVELKVQVSSFGFRVAELYMKKDERSTLDSFMTTRGISYEDIHLRTMACIEFLIDKGYNVRRYKIENTLVDVKFFSTGLI